MSQKEERWKEGMDWVEEKSEERPQVKDKHRTAEEIRVVSTHTDYFVGAKGK